jgi:hypothetical protein
MAERFSSDLLFIVIVLLIAAILGFLIGYFLRKRKAAGEVEPAESPGTASKRPIMIPLWPKKSWKWKLD